MPDLPEMREHVPDFYEMVCRDVWPMVQSYGDEYGVIVTVEKVASYVMDWIELARSRNA